MPETDIGNTVASDLTNTVTDYSVAAVETDGATGTNEVEWIKLDPNLTVEVIRK